MFIQLRCSDKVLVVNREVYLDKVKYKWFNSVKFIVYYWRMGYKLDNATPVIKWSPKKEDKLKKK